MSHFCCTKYIFFILSLSPTRGIVSFCCCHCCFLDASTKVQLPCLAEMIYLHLLAKNILFSSVFVVFCRPYYYDSFFFVAENTWHFFIQNRICSVQNILYMHTHIYIHTQKWHPQTAKSNPCVGHMFIFLLRTNNIACVRWMYFVLRDLR